MWSRCSNRGCHISRLWFGETRSSSLNKSGEGAQETLIKHFAKRHLQQLALLGRSSCRDRLANFSRDSGLRYQCRYLRSQIRFSDNHAASCRASLTCLASRGSRQCERSLSLQLCVRNQVEGVKGEADACEGEKHDRVDFPYSGLDGMLKIVEAQADASIEPGGWHIHGANVKRKFGSNKQAVHFQAGELWRRMAKVGHDRPILPTLHDWIAQGNPVHKNIIIVAITSLKREKRFKQALEVSEWVWKERPFKLDELDHLYRLYLTGEAGEIEDVEKCFAGIPSEWQTESVCNQLISCYITRDMLINAKYVLAKLRDTGKLISACSYNQFISYYRRHHQDENIFDMMGEMKKAGIAPDTSTYNILLSVKHRHGDVKGLQEIFKEMISAGVPPNLLTYFMVGRAYLAAGLANEAEAVTREIEKLDTLKGPLTHNLLVSLYAEQGKLREVERLWRRVKSFSRFSYRSYGVMIEAFGKLGQIQKAEDLVEEVRRKKGKLSLRIYNALLYAYSRHGMMQAAEDLVIRILKNNLQPDAVTYHHLATGYLKIGEINKAIEILKKSQDNLTYDHSQLWLDTLFLIMESLAETGDVDEAEQVFQTFTRKGRHRTTMLYNRLLKVYLKASKHAPGFLQRMSADGLHPDTETWTLLEDMDSRAISFSNDLMA